MREDVIYQVKKSIPNQHKHVHLAIVVQVCSHARKIYVLPAWYR